jgi:DNA-directed RNA polymerase beta' subunit
MSKIENNEKENPSKIIGVQFSILSPEEIRKGSVAEITSRDTYINNKPVIGGLFDPRMGVLEPGLICPTDGLDYMQTPGYFGHINLSRPVFYIQYLNTIIKILRCTCIKCSKCLINKEKYKYFMKMPPDERWNQIFSIASKIKRCGEDTEDGCNSKQPNKIKKEGLATIIAEWVDNDTMEDENSKISLKLTPERVIKNFKKISDEDVNFMGFSPIWSRPDWMVCQVLAVPPPAVRPSVKHDSQQRSEDDISHIIVNIIKANNTLADKIAQNANSNVIDDWVTVLQYYVSTLVDNKIPGVASVAQRSGRPLKSIKERLNGKAGRVRGNLMGKRVDFSARSVITPDPQLSIRELGVPLKVAKNLTKPIVVNNKNMNYLLKLVRNGPDIYPGAKILEKKNGESISLKYVDRESIKLQVGDKVHRHMMNGDAILFNRQPTLHKMSMMCHIVKIMPQGDTFRMNVGDTKPYNADFDGDEMNLHMPQDEQSETELKMLAAVPYQIISPANNKSIVGIFQDSMLGSYLFSQENINFDKRKAMNLIVGLKNIDTSIFNNETITNYNLLSQIIPPISLKYKLKNFDDSEDYKTSNHVVEIYNGNYIRGELQKGVLGDGSKGLIQRICNDYGNMASSDFIDNLQSIITEYMKTHAYSVGISDLIANYETNKSISDVIADKKRDVDNLIDQTHLGIFENKTGKLTVDEFETQVNNVLNKASLEAGKIGRKSLSKNNRFVIMVNAGSKGSDLNISQMISCLGQQNVDGKRIPYGFENRSLPHFNKYDDSPGARGFVESSFISGLSPSELFFHAMGGRVGLIDTAVKSVTWETPIVIIENNEPKYVKIGEFVDNKMNNNNLVEKHNERNLELLNTNNIYIPTTNENGIVSWEEVTALTRHDPGEKLYQIKTLGGRDVIVTENKSLLIWQSNEKKFKEMFSTDIKIGDCVPVTKDLCDPPVIKNYILLEKYLSKKEYIYGTDFNIACKLMKENMNNKKKISDNWWDKNNTINFTLPYGKKSSLQRCIVRSNFQNISEQFVYPYSGIRNNTKIPEKFELNNDNGIFIGLFLAEGNINNSHITITNNDESIRNFVKSWFDSYNIKYNETLKINKLNGTTTTITGNSCIMSEFITKLVGSGAKNKYVPDEAFIAPKDFIIGILNGYFSGDGYISNNSVEASSASKRLIEGINMLCSRLNIFGKVFTTNMKKNNINTKNILPTHRISIRAQWGKIFAEKINLINNDKNRKLNNANFTNIHRNFNIYNNVVLDKIIEINIIGVENHPKMYDLTIPTTLNFGLANGLQVRDTSQTGYIQRRLIKGLEDLKVSYDMTVRNNKNKIIQFHYGDDNFDPVKVEFQMLPIVKMTKEDIYNHYQLPMSDKDKNIISILSKDATKKFKSELNEFNKKNKIYIELLMNAQKDIVEKIFKNQDNKTIHMPVGFTYIINNIMGQQVFDGNSLIDISPLECYNIIEEYFEKLNKIYYAKPNQLFKILYYYYLSPKDLLFNKRFNKKSLIYLLDTILLAYKKSIVAPGEMVGMIAAQSIGEPTTQMSETKNAVKKIIIVSKNGNVNHKTIKIGELCDNFIEKYPEYTFPTGHPNSLETLLDKLDEEYYIVGVDKNERTSWNRISHFSRHPVNGDLMTIKTKSGRTVTTTLSHSHLCRKEHQVEPIKGSELTIGMRIPVCKHIDNKFVVNTIEIGNNKYNLDKQLGWFIGAYLAEGNCSGNEICITNIHKHYINSTLEIAKLFNTTGYLDTTPGEYGPSTKSKFKNKELAKFLLENCGKNSYEKKVPEFIFTAPLECKAAVLQGYMDGDGNINCDKNHHEIRSCSRSETLIKDLSLLFNYFDIFTTLIENVRQNKPLYHFAISSSYAHIYKEKIGSVVKEDKLEELCNYVNRSNIHSLSNDIDKIEGLGEIIAKCGKELKLPGQSRNYGRWKNKTSIGRRTLQKYIKIFKQEIGEQNILQDEIKLLEQAVNSNIIWDEIINIEIYTPDQNEYVYDFTVPGNQTFMENNGIIVHNTLNTFHFAGVASKSNVTRGVPRIEEILSLSENPKNPSCTIFLPKNIYTNQNEAKKILHEIEHTKLRDIVKGISICFDPDDSATNIEEDKETLKQYYEFANMIEECNGIKELDEKQKSKWIIRLEMNDMQMLEKNITMEDVNFAIKNIYQTDVNCIYSDFNADKLIFRIRINNIIQNKKKILVASLDQSDEIYLLKNFQEQLLDNVILRGIKNISNVLIRKIVDYLEPTDNGYEKKDIWVLDTTGTNLLEILALDNIDVNNTVTNDIQEIYRVLGEEAARQSIFNELSEVIEFDSTYINYHHLSVLCDRMTCNDKLTSIFRHGINNDNIGPIAKASFEETPEMFLKAARHAELDNMKGLSANVMCGQEGYFGTSSFQVMLDINKMLNEEEDNIWSKQDPNEIISKEFADIADPNDPCNITNIGIQTNINNIKAVDMGDDNDYDPFA